MIQMNLSVKQTQGHRKQSCAFTKGVGVGEGGIGIGAADANCHR